MAVLGALLLLIQLLSFACGFYNPIVAKGQDPSVKFYDGNYYLVQSVSDNIIVVMKSAKLEGLGSPDQNVTVWTGTGSLCCQVWAPELFYLDDTGLWYIYFAADDGVADNHRSYVLQSSSNDPLGPYTFIGQTVDEWAIDSTVMKLNGQLYFIWSGWVSETDHQQDLFIATMSSPTNVNSSRYLLSEPTNSWEYGLNEGPAVLQVNGTTWIDYSASATNKDTYCLALLTYTGGDPLQQSSWVKSDGCQFSTNVNNSVYGPGHNCFTTSPDLTQVWNVYAAREDSETGSQIRSVRAQQLNFNADGTPNYGTPVGFQDWVDPPSGE